MHSNKSLGRCVRSNCPKWQEKFILRIRSFHIHRLKFNLQPKITKDNKELGYLCKPILLYWLPSTRDPPTVYNIKNRWTEINQNLCKIIHMCRLENNSFSIFIAFISIDSSSTYNLEKKKHMSGNRELGRRVRARIDGLTRVIHSPYSFHLPSKIIEEHARQLLIGEVVKSHQCRLGKNSFFMFELTA